MAATTAIAIVTIHWTGSTLKMIVIRIANPAARSHSTPAIPSLFISASLTVQRHGRGVAGFLPGRSVGVYGVDYCVRRRLASVARDVKTRRGLTKEGVVDAALRAADEGGLEAVSL